MASQTPINRLVQQVDGLTLDSVAEKFPNCYPEINPFDLYRAHLTNILATITGVDSKIIYPSLSWTQGLDKGDLVLAAPALRIKGKKPDELVLEWAEKVSVPNSPPYQVQCATALTIPVHSFPEVIRSSRNLRFTATSCPFLSRALPSFKLSSP
jgi:hypothetical protein